jgi:hypothetical protein
VKSEVEIKVSFLLKNLEIFFNKNKIKIKSTFWRFVASKIKAAYIYMLL